MQLCFCLCAGIRTDRIAQFVSRTSLQKTLLVLVPLPRTLLPHCRVLPAAAAGWPFQPFPLSLTLTPDSSLSSQIVKPSYPAFSPRATHQRSQSARPWVLSYFHDYFRIRGSETAWSLTRSHLPGCPDEQSCAILRVESVSVIATISTTISCAAIVSSPIQV